MSAPTETARIPFVDLLTQQASIRPELDEAIARVTNSAAYIMGPDVTALEQSFASYCQAQHAIGVDSGTSALELALRAFEIGAGDEVITVANTFVATALAISYTGATPVLVDAEPVTYMIDPSKVERAITDRTRAILPVHLYGHPADMDAIVAVARAHDLVVIEDACQAHGARYKGRRAGSLGDAAAFSFYPGKNLGGFGDGGMVVTSDPEVATRVRLLRNYGGEVKYIHRELGFNRRLDTLQAAILNVKLAHLDTWNEARRRHAAQYMELLAGSRVQTPRAAPWAEPVWHLYTVQLEERDALREYLAARGIETGIHYPIPVHLQECYEQLGYRPGDFPVTEAQASHMVSLPMYPEMSEDAIARIADAVIAFGRELH